MDFVYKAQEWLADRVKWVQYPKPRVKNHNGYATGLKLRWQMRKPMNRWLAFVLPTAFLFVPWIGVYLSIACVIFLLAYFKRG
jgi:hypothetical protein